MFVEILPCVWLNAVDATPSSRRTVLVGIVGLLGAALVANPLRYRSRGIAAVALASPHNGLVNGPCWRVCRPVGVELGIIACGVGKWVVGVN